MRHPQDRFSIRVLLGLCLVVCLVVCLGAPAVAVECLTPREWQPKTVNRPMDDDRNYIHDTLDALQPGASARVIVQLNRCPEDTDLERLARFGQLAYQSRWLSYVVLEDVQQERLAELAEDDVVAFLEADREFFYMLDVSNPAMRVKPSGTYSPNTIHDAYPTITGTGVNIAIVDSGVDDLTHESFIGKFVAGSNCGSNPCVDGNPPDTVGHGTHVAGIALGTGGGSETYQGIAPDAGLVDITVDGGVNFWSAVLRAMEKVLDKRVAWDIGVVNMSIGDCVATNGLDAVSMKANRMVEEGIAVVVAAGNCSNCGLPPNCSIVMAPGAGDRVISVANANDVATVPRGDDAINSGSVQGPRLSDGDADTSDEEKPDVAGYGTTIRSAQWGTVSGYTDKTGTSMAAPAVAGCAALLKQQIPALTPLSLKKLLRDTSEDKGAAGWDAAWGQGLVDCFEALDELNQQVDTDLGYTQECGASPLPPCWLHPSLYPSNPMISEGVGNTINADIENLGPDLAAPFDVKLSVYNFSNGDLTYDICTQTVPGLASGATTTVSCPWTPSISGTPPGTVHACLKAQIIYPFDISFSNNFAQHNIDIEQTSSPARFRMEVDNKTEQTLRMVLQDRFDCDGEPCRGWRFDADANEFPLAADECPRQVEMFLDPAEPGAVREARVLVEVVGLTEQGQEIEQGGVALQARIGCLTTSLHFPPGQPPAANKTRFSWEPETFFEACPRVFDVARGKLPIRPLEALLLRGDFSEAECLADDVQEPAFDDPAQPAPAEGFWYLTRAGGQLSGSWETGATSQVGPRDDTLTSCP